MHFRILPTSFEKMDFHVAMPRRPNSCCPCENYILLATISLSMFLSLSLSFGLFISTYPLFFFFYLSLTIFLSLFSFFPYLPQLLFLSPIFYFYFSLSSLLLFFRCGFLKQLSNNSFQSEGQDN
jgi:hypothetical protein